VIRVDSSTIADLVRRSGGIARGRDLCRQGVTRKALCRAVAGESLVRIRDGVYAVPGVDPAVYAAAEHGGELCCASALRAHGIWVLEPRPRRHVWVGPGGRVHHARCRCVTHRDVGRSAFGTVSLVHALVQVASCLGAEAFFAAFESAWNRGLLTGSDRREIRLRLRAGMRWLVDIARPTSDSGLESLLRLRLHRLGIVLESQVWIDRVGRVDFLLAGRIILEVDGRENHDGQSLRHKDLRRDAAAAAQGYETLRFDYAMMVHSWPDVEAAVLGRLALIRP
jgi:very-short-patch-repair endonuclease